MEIELNKLRNNSPKKDLTQDQVQSLFNYNDKTGELFWKEARYKDRQWLEAGHWHNRGYRQVRVREKEYLVHRIIWLYVYGTHPEEIDHINGDKADNRLENLRAGNKSLNQRNAKRRKDNKSGMSGVNWCNREQRWIVRIQYNKRRIMIGQYTDLEKAKAARLAAQEKFSFGPNAGK